MILKTLTWKTTFRFAVLVTVTTAFFLAVGGWLIDRQMRRGLNLLHEGEAQELLGFLAGAAPTPEAVRERVLRDSEGDAEWFFIQIHDESGRILFRSANLGTAMMPDLSPGQTRRVLNLAGVGPVQMSEVRENGWHIQVGSPLASEHLLLTEYAQVSLGLVVAAALGGLVLGYGFSRVTLKPVRQIVETARRISGENLHERIEVSASADELAELGRVLNQTFDRLQASFEQVRQFSADVSHELKTPLALMHLNADKLRERLSGGVDEATLDDFVEAMERMQLVIDRLLFLARADGGVRVLKAESVSVGGLIESFSDDASVLAEDVGATFEVVQCDTGEIQCEAILLRQLLLNLVSNASRVSPRGGRVVMTAKRLSASWQFSVEDEGPGLPAAHLEKVFGRFVRYQPMVASVSNDHSGHGLGLAICRSIAQLHGGRIWAENLVGHRGLRVVVDIPANIAPMLGQSSMDRP